MEQQKDLTAISRAVLVFLFVVLVGLSGYFVLHRIARNTSSGTLFDTAGPTVEPTPAVVRDSVLLLRTDTSKTPMVGVPMTVYVDADSKNADIIGYDAIVQYDPRAMEFVSVTSAIADFDIFRRIGTNSATVTGTKAIQAKGKSIFTKTPLLVYTFRPKKSGPTTFTLKGTLGKLQSKLVDTQVKPMFAADNPLQVVVQ